MPPNGKKGLPPWLIPTLGGSLAVLALAVVYLLVFDDSGDDNGDDQANELAAEETGDDNSDADNSEADSSEGSDDSDVDTQEPVGETYDPERLTGTWEGSYECDYGEADLRLTVDDYPGEDGVGANWNFVSGDDEGMFFMEGSYVDGELSLESTGWEEELEPSGYDQHDLTADLSDFDGGDTIEAEVSGDGCGDVTLERTDTEPWYVGTFEGIYECNQGRTGTRLAIEAVGPDQVVAFNEFYDVGEADDPIPDGSMYMTGTYVDRELTLTLDEWELRPVGYEAVDIVSYAAASTHPERFHGSFPGVAGCSLIGLDRIEDEGVIGPTEDGPTDPGD